MGLKDPGVQGVHGLRGLAEAKLKNRFYKTFLKLPMGDWRVDERTTLNKRMNCC